jgi:hypothetical protein
VSGETTASFAAFEGLAIVPNGETSAPDLSAERGESGDIVEYVPSDGDCVGEGAANGCPWCGGTPSNSTGEAALIS